MAEFPTVWVENSADSLLDIAIRFCVKNPRAFCQYNPREGGYELREGLSLPEEICERMLAVCKIELKEGDFESLIKLFKDTNRTRLRQVDLSNSRVTDKTLEILANHKITELDISGCKQLTQAALDSIAKLWDGLQSLIIGSSSHIFEERTSKTSEIQDDHLLHHCMGLLYGNVEDNVLIHSEPQTPTYLQLPLLRKVVIHDVPKSEQNLCFMSLMKSAQYLTYLDLSKCELNANEMNAIIMSKNLISLILCDVPNIRDLFHAICEIKTLRHLDISNTADHVIMYDSPNATLKRIVKSLENLVSLDISGTNLAGGRTQDRYTLETGLYDDSLTDIPGLASRVNRPLEFLGLLNCAFDACYRHHIPAKRIAGDASEEQILTAGQAYYAREPMIQKVLNDLFQIFRFSTCNNTKLALDVVMEAMRLHLRVKHIQVSGSASLFYIVKGEHKELFNIKMRRKIIKLLIDAMFLHYSDVTMLRNGCLTLIHFKIPDDVMKPLLIMQGFWKERGMDLFLGCINKIFYSFLDETPINCARFLEGKGMDLFLGCLEAFPQKPELLRNMMGLLGNVAEVKELRCHLMKDEYLLVFSQLLNSKSDGIEVSYNAAGILSHIASDGPEPWITHNITAVKRDEVLKQMVEAIEKWNLDTKRNINYRSFKPILRLLTVEHTPEAQHWAVWALANLTKVYPEKYCNLLKEEGGIELLQNLLQKPSYSRIHQLAEITINNCVRYQERSTDPAYDDEEDDEDALDVT
ncbi:Protein zer-1 like protein [Argiope bruennichi]|uniref:Protein zer-1 like protein n=1 Tax=Argiope bruennichi TaxID=94029 RepID=A0A8T0EPD0_ARGBR|nr:Protein zer-1 like protein [Argiope bruennichi]